MSAGLGTAWGAVGTLARHELRTRWRTIVAMGVACGAFAAAALAVATVLWRTDSAYSRLVSASALDDVRVSAFFQYRDPAQRPAVVARTQRNLDSLRHRPEVVAAAQLGQFVGRLPGPGVAYASIIALSRTDPDVARPVVVRGRMPAPGRADEVVIEQSAASARRIGVGSRLGMDLLTNTQFLQFSTGIGRPAGGHVDLRVVGVFRYPKPSHLYTALVAGPAFAAAHRADAAGAALVLTTRGHAGAAAFAAPARAIDRAMSASFGLGQMPYAAIEGPRASPDPGIGATRAVLRSGLLALIAVVVAAGLILSAQLSGRWAVRERQSQQIEHALGLTARERALARLLAATPAILLVAGLAVAGALFGGLAEPLGSLRRYEPTPGWLPRPLFAAVGAVVAAAVVAGTVLVVALRSGRRARAFAPRRLRRPLRLSRVPAFAAALSIGRGGPRTTMPVRPMVTGLASMLAVLVVIADLHPQLSGLSHRPAKWGWTADFSVLDDTPKVDAQVRADPRARDVERSISAQLRVHRRTRAVTIQTYGWTRLRGNLPWTIASGRLPTRPDEIALGPRAAHDLHVEVGDSVDVDRADIGTVTQRVVGVIVLPTGNSEPLGSNALMTGAELMSLGVDNPYSSISIRATDPAAAAALRAELGRAYELDSPVPPDTVAALDELSNPTRVLLAILFLAVALLVAQNTRMLLRRRRSQLAVADAIGMSRGELVGVACGSVLLTSSLAALVGLPVGWAVSRLVLAEIGPRLGLGLHSPALVPMLLAGLALLVLTALVSAGAAWYATGRRRIRLRHD